MALFRREATDILAHIVPSIEPIGELNADRKLAAGSPRGGFCLCATTVGGIVVPPIQAGIEGQRDCDHGHVSTPLTPQPPLPLLAFFPVKAHSECDGRSKKDYEQRDACRLERKP